MPAALVVGAIYALGLGIAEVGGGAAHAISSIALLVILIAYCATRPRNRLLLFLLAAIPGLGGALFHSLFDWDRAITAVVLLVPVLAALHRLDRRFNTVLHG